MDAPRPPPIHTKHTDLEEVPRRCSVHNGAHGVAEQHLGADGPPEPTKVGGVAEEPDSQWGQGGGRGGGVGQRKSGEREGSRRTSQTPQQVITPFHTMSEHASTCAHVNVRACETKVDTHGRGCHARFLTPGASPVHAIGHQHVLLPLAVSDDVGEACLGGPHGRGSEELAHHHQGQASQNGCAAALHTREPRRFHPELHLVLGQGWFHRTQPRTHAHVRTPPASLLHPAQLLPGSSSNSSLVGV